VAAVSGRVVGVLGAALLAAVLVGCGGSSDKKVATATSTTSTTTSTTTTTTTTTTTAPPTTLAPATSAPRSATTQAPASAAPDTGPSGAADPGPQLLFPPSAPFQSSVSYGLDAATLGASWQDGCPVAPQELAIITVSYVDFGGGTQTGSVVMASSVAPAIVNVFRRLYEAGFPQHGLEVIDTQAEYDDFETPDTTGFSCRPPLGGSGFSQHSYGTAIDIDPVENPYIHNGSISPAAGAAYTDRRDVRPGMITSGDLVVQAMNANGFTWGVGFGDYQHFSTSGS
jgi:hypothetical protein